MQITVRRSSAASSQSLEMFDAAQPSLGGLWQQLRLKVVWMRGGVTDLGAGRLQQSAGSPGWLLVCGCEWGLAVSGKPAHHSCTSSYQP